MVWLQHVLAAIFAAILAGAVTEHAQEAPNAGRRGYFHMRILESGSNRFVNAITLIFHQILPHHGVQAAARRRDISLTLAI